VLIVTHKPTAQGNVYVSLFWVQPKYEQTHQSVAPVGDEYAQNIHYHIVQVNFPVGVVQEQYTQKLNGFDGNPRSNANQQGAPHRHRCDEGDQKAEWNRKQHIERQTGPVTPDRTAAGNVQRVQVDECESRNQR